MQDEIDQLRSQLRSQASAHQVEAESLRQQLAQLQELADANSTKWQRKDQALAGARTGSEPNGCFGRCLCCWRDRC